MKHLSFTLRLHVALYGFLVFSNSNVFAQVVNLRTWEVFETSYNTSQTFRNTYTECIAENEKSYVTARFSGISGEAAGKTIIVPGFWDGAGLWRIRFAPPASGTWKYETLSKDKRLTGKKGELKVTGWSEEEKKDNPVRRGFIKVNSSGIRPGRYFTYTDGTPCLWIADTWWDWTNRNITFESFKKLVDTRVDQGYNIGQLFFAGNGWGRESSLLDSTFAYPDIEQIRKVERMIAYANSQGMTMWIHPWWSRENLANTVGTENMRRWWRYVIQRLHAYNVIWVLAGEYNMNNYGGFPIDFWNSLGELVKSEDPYDRIVGAHPTPPMWEGGAEAPQWSTAEAIHEQVWLDYNQSQCGHARWCNELIPEIIREAYSRNPAKPVVVTEPWYEFIDGNPTAMDIRFAAWSAVMSGAAGHTYGGGHIWRAHLPERPTGVGAWPMDTNLTTNTMLYPGAVSVGFMGKYLGKLDWWKLEPHPELTGENPSQFCLADPGREYIFYLRYGGSVKLDLGEFSDSVLYTYHWTDLVNGRDAEHGTIQGGKTAEIKCPEDYPGTVIFKDWILHIKASGEIREDALPKRHDPLAEGFLNPPVIARPKALWPWVNGNFSLSQITFELEQAKQKGMGGFDIWDAGTNMNPDHIVPDGPAFLSDESVNAIAHTIREADRLGLEIGLITSSSWNAGGAWVKPEHGAMGLFRTDTLITGPVLFSGMLPLPQYPEVLKNSGSAPFYREVALLACPFRNDSSLNGLNEIIDLGKIYGNSGKVNWEVPPGIWKITRYVCMPTGQQLAIPSAASKGLMLDHFSSDAQEANMQYVLNRLKSVLGTLNNRSLKYLYEDSYEVNSAVWTTDLPEQFEKRTGYSIIPYLPVLDGFTIGSGEITKRFLFDFTKLLSDLIIENHYRLGRKLAEAEGLGFYAEAGGPGKPIHNVPFEDLKALGSLTVPRGEFWNKHPQLDKLQIIKGIASASHIYNQKYVEAESFTSVWLWQEGPGELKPLADRAMCEGLNRFVYHTFPHTPPESGVPGWIYNFGTIINTTNGWWPKSEGFHEYLARCSYLLQQGNFVGDVAFYYGDKAPNFVSPKHIPPSLGHGYDYDVVNSDIILNRMTVKNGRICLPHGQVYEVLVLPNEKQINPEVLRKIEQLVADGATVIGPRPTGSYSLAHATEQDAIVRDLAGRLWGKCDSFRVRENIYGKGRVVWGITIREVLEQKKVYPDLQLKGDGNGNPVDFIHRTVDGTDIYFIRNKGDQPLNTTCSFRINGKLPEYWDPQTGEIKPIDLFNQHDFGTELPLSLGSYGSCFIVFREPLLDRKGKAFLQGEEILFTPEGGVQLQPEPLLELEGAWEVRFLHKPGTPVVTRFNQLVSWDKSDIPSIRNFSGTGSYRTTFTMPAEFLKDDYVLFLELNRVKEIAEVYLNGTRLGLHWDPAHRFTISGIVRPGENQLVIEVVNSINNLLVGEAGKPEQFRQTRSNITKLPNAWTTPFAEAPLIEAGLIGPVVIRWARLVDHK